CSRRWWQSAPPSWGPIISTRSAAGATWRRCMDGRGTSPWPSHSTRKCWRLAPPSWGPNTPTPSPPSSSWPRSTHGTPSTPRLYLWHHKHAPAEALFKELVASRTAKLGADHRDTLNAQHELAWLYRSMRKFDQSIPLLENILTRRKAKYGPDDPDALDAQSDL